MIDLRKIGHGRVVKRDDGVQCRCLGQAHCEECRIEAELLRLQEALRLGVVALETIRQKLGFGGFIDTAADAGLSHYGYLEWLRVTGDLLGEFEVVGGQFKQPTTDTE